MRSSFRCEKASEREQFHVFFRFKQASTTAPSMSPGVCWGSDRLDADGFVVFLTKPFPTASLYLTRHKYTDPSMTYPASFLATPLSRQKKRHKQRHTHKPNGSYSTTWTPRSPPPPPIASVESERESASIFCPIEGRENWSTHFPISTCQVAPQAPVCWPVNLSIKALCGGVAEGGGGGTCDHPAS